MRYQKSSKENFAICSVLAFNEITYIEFRGTCKCFGGVLICPRGEAAINVTGEFGICIVLLYSRNFFCDQTKFLALFIGYSDKELAWLRTKVNEDFVKKQSGLEHHDPNRAIEAALNHMIDVLVEPDADGILPVRKPFK